MAHTYCSTTSQQWHKHGKNRATSENVTAECMDFTHTFPFLYISLRFISVFCPILLLSPSGLYRDSKRTAMSLCLHSVGVWPNFSVSMYFFFSFFLTDSKNVPRICNRTHTESIHKMSRTMQFCGTTTKFQRFFISVCPFQSDHRTKLPALHAFGHPL